MHKILKGSDEYIERPLVRAERLENGQRAVLEFRWKPISRERRATFLDRRDLRWVEIGETGPQSGELERRRPFRFERDEFGKQSAVRQPCAVVDLVQGTLVPVEFAFEGLDARGISLALPLPFGRAAGGPHMQRLDLVPYRTHHGFSIAVNIGEHHDPLSEILSFETLTYYLESRLLLADDEERFSAADCISDHVDDRLALSCSRRALDDETGCGTGLHYGLLLGGIAIGSKESLELACASSRLSLAASLGEPQHRLQSRSGG